MVDSRNKSQETRFLDIRRLFISLTINPHNSSFITYNSLKPVPLLSRTQVKNRSSYRIILFNYSFFVIFSFEIPNCHSMNNEFYCQFIKPDLSLNSFVENIGM